MPGLAQRRRGVLGGRDGERIDDSAAGQVGQVGDEPGEALLWRPHRQDPQPKRVPREPSALGRDCVPARAELFDDVVYHPGVGGGGRGEHRGALGQGGEQVADAPVVRAEVVPPVADAVGLVDDEQAAARREVGQLLVAEPRAVEPLRADQEDVDGVGEQLGPDPPPVLRVGRGDRLSPDARPRRRANLVAHQGQQR